MSLATNVSDLATVVSTEVKRNRTFINGNVLNLDSLDTTAKSNLVLAINEVKGVADAAAGGGVSIDDTQVRLDATWSSDKTNAEIDATSTTDRARANHTGTQAATTITGLATVATSGDYDDLTNTPTIPATYTDLTGTVPQSALPAVALTDYLGEVASQSALLALVGQRGDWATRTDLGTDWQLTADDSSLIGSWRELTYPTSPVSSVNGRTGAVTGLAEAAQMVTDYGDPTSGFNFAATFEAGLL